MRGRSEAQELFGSWTSRLWLYYLTASLLIGITAVAGYLILTSVHEQQKALAELMNVTGRQRMFSQRIALLASELVYTRQNVSERQHEMAERATIMQSTHDALRAGQLPGRQQLPLSADVQRLYRDGSMGLDQAVPGFVAAALALAQAETGGLTSDNGDYVLIEQNADLLLNTFDRIVDLYEAENERMIERVSRDISLALVSILGVIAFEIFFIFRPMERAVNQRETALREESAQRQRIAEDLQLSEERYRQMFEETAVAKLIIDTATGEIVDANASATAFYGYTREHLRTLCINDLNMLSDEEMLGRIRKYLAEDQRYYRLKHRLANGAVRDVDVFIVPVQLRDRLVLYTSIIDATPRRQLEEARWESEARFQGAFDFSPIGIALVGLAGNWIQVNPRLTNILGYSADELVSMTFQELTYPDDLDLDLKFVQSLMAGEIDSYQIEKRYVRKDGQIVDALLGVALVRDSEGEPRYFVSQIIDITQYKQAVRTAQELELERGRIQLLSDFIRDTSHDLKTPISIMSTNLYLLRRQAEVMNDQQALKQLDKITRIEHELNYLTAILDQMQQMAILDSTNSLETMPLLINDLLKTIVARTQDRIDQRQLQVTLDLDEKLPKAQYAYTWMSTALYNLMDNALLFTQDGGYITIESHQNGAQVIITIRNQATIPPDDVAHIFERFYKADEARGQHTGGAGLGLPMAQRIIELHNGIIEAESDETETRFVITLPLKT